MSEIQSINPPIKLGSLTIRQFTPATWEDFRLSSLPKEPGKHICLLHESKDYASDGKESPEDDVENGEGTRAYTIKVSESWVSYVRPYLPLSVLVLNKLYNRDLRTINIVDEDKSLLSVVEKVRCIENICTYLEVRYWPPEPAV